ncbi:MAG: phosphoribosyltransferase [Desulfocucumaceae bacterium]
MFRDRAEAGLRLAEELKKKHLQNVVVLCIPRGGAVVGAVVAEELNAGLEIVVPRKIGAPVNPEVAIGAVAQDGSTFLNENIIARLGIDKKTLESLIKEAVREIERRIKGYRGTAGYPDFRKKTVVLVDDGAATGYTMLAAARFARETLRPERLIIAVPVSPPGTLGLFRQEADEVVCPVSPDPFYAVGQFYDDFEQTSDGEVLAIIKKFS